jgi:hypothetical protein
MGSSGVFLYIQLMKKQKITDVEDWFLVSSNDYEDDGCPVCLLMRECKKEGREPTLLELQSVMKKTEHYGEI